MLLASRLGAHPDELRADFQRYYNLNIDGMGCDYSVAHAVSLCAALPRDSSTVRAEHPEAAWSDETYLLSAIEYDLRILIWQRTKDGQKGRNQPKPMQTPADVARVADKLASTDMEGIAAALGIDLGGD
jgi:hypothetical protein